jgi:transposase
VRTGGSWRMLPKAFPAWQNVYRTFRRWTEQGQVRTDARSLAHPVARTRRP